MTVKDLIVYLERLPRDAVIGVVYMRCSENVVLEEGDMHFIPAPDATEADSLPPRNRYFEPENYVLRHGKIQRYDPRTWDVSETPHFVAVLALPGN